MICFSSTAWQQYLYWQEKDFNKVEKINALIKDTLRHPFTGIGKPEPLKRSYKGYWSRRIDDEHRLIYKYENNTLIIISCRFHY